MADQITGRCYCGAVQLSASAPPQTVVYCHCTDCRRVTGAPVTAWAAFGADDIAFAPDAGPARSLVAGVTRWSCPTCASPLAAEFSYLPGQTYVPIGLLDQAADLPPTLHAHAGAALPWLHLTDDLPRISASSRETLQAAGT